MPRLRWIRFCVILPSACLVSCAHINESYVFDQGEQPTIKAARTKSGHFSVDKPTSQTALSQTDNADQSVAEVPALTQVELESTSSVREAAVSQLAGTQEEMDTLTQTAFEPSAVPPAPGAGSTESGDIDAVQPTSMALNVDDVVDMAMLHNPTLEQAAAVVYKAKGIRNQVGLIPNPQVGYSGNEIGNDGRAGQQGFYYSQTFVRGCKLELNQEVAEADVQRLEWEYQAQRYRVSNDVKSQFYATLGAQRQLELTHKLEKVAEAGVDIAEQLFRAGQAARPDILQAEIQLGEIRILRQNAEYDLESAKQQLASLVGDPGLTAYTFTGELDKDTVKWTWEEAYQNLLAQSPEIMAAYQTVSRSRSQIIRQESQVIPNLLTQIGAAHDNATGSDIANIQIGIPIPIFNRNQGNIETATSEYQRAVKDIDRLQLSLKKDLAVAYRDYQKAHKQVERYKQDILPKAQSNLDLTTKGYENQQFNFLRVLTARRTYFETNIRYVKSLIDLRQSEVAVNGMVLTGGLRDVMDISQGVGGTGNRGQALSGQ